MKARNLASFANNSELDGLPLSAITNSNMNCTFELQLNSSLSKRNSGRTYCDLGKCSLFYLTAFIHQSMKRITEPYLYSCYKIPLQSNENAETSRSNTLEKNAHSLDLYFRCIKRTTILNLLQYIQLCSSIYKREINVCH